MPSSLPLCQQHFYFLLGVINFFQSQLVISHCSKYLFVCVCVLVMAISARKRGPRMELMNHADDRSSAIYPTNRQPKPGNAHQTEMLFFCNLCAACCFCWAGNPSDPGSWDKYNLVLFNIHYIVWCQSITAAIAPPNGPNGPMWTW